MENFEQMKRECIERRKAWYAKLKELGFVAEVSVRSTELFEGRPAWGGIHFLKDDGTWWGDANDGNVVGIGGTCLVLLPPDVLAEPYKITSVTSILED